MIGERCDRCSPEAVVGDMWFYTRHLSHHVVKRSRAKRRVAKPDFLICVIELFTFTISWSLKESI